MRVALILILIVAAVVAFGLAAGLIFAPPRPATTLRPVHGSISLPPPFAGERSPSGRRIVPWPNPSLDVPEGAKPPEAMDV